MQNILRKKQLKQTIQFECREIKVVQQFLLSFADSIKYAKQYETHENSHSTKIEISAPNP